MEKTDNEYFKVKKPVAIGSLIALGAVLAALITFTVLDHIKLGELESKITDADSSMQMMGPGGGTPPDMNGEMPEMNGETPELPESKSTDSSSDSSSTSSRPSKKSSTTN